MPIAANSTAGVGADSGGLSTTAMKAQFPRALHREKESAGHGARRGKTCARRTGAGEATLCCADGADAPLGSWRTKRRLEVVPRSNSSRREECLAILSIDRAGRLPNDLGDLVR